MNSSAKASSSAVVTPGAIAAPTMASVRATSSPDFAICSISDGDLRMITEELLSKRSSVAWPRSAGLHSEMNSCRAVEHALDLGKHLVHTGRGINGD